MRHARGRLRGVVPLRGELRVRVEGDRVVDLAATPPLAAKVRCAPHGTALTIVGTAASLLEGDVLRVVLELGPGARLDVTTAAAQLAHPCPDGGGTTVEVTAALAAGAALVWRPEPTVVCAGGRHRAAAAVTLADGAAALWLDEVVLGRSGEDPTDAALAASLAVDHCGRPLLRDGLDTGLPGARGPAVLGRAARYVGTVHAWGRAVGPGPSAEGVTRFDLAGPGALWRVVTADVAAGRAAIAAAGDALAAVAAEAGVH